MLHIFVGRGSRERGKSVPNNCVSVQQCHTPWWLFPPFFTRRRNFRRDVTLLGTCTRCEAPHGKRVENTEWQRPIFWRTFHHDGNICPGWWGGGGACPLPTPFYYSYHHTQSCSVRSSWVGRYTHYVSSLPIYVLCGWDLRDAISTLE